MRRFLAALLLLPATPLGAEDMNAAFVQERLSLPRMELIDHNAERRDLSELTTDAIIVINFNYTLCGSICPIGNDVMAEVDDLLENMPGHSVRLLSVTIDPTRDTPMLLNEAATKFDASDKWSWLTGDPHDIESLLQAVDAEVVDVELHEPIFLIGNADSGLFYRALVLPTPEEIMDRIDSFGS